MNTKQRILSFGFVRLTMMAMLAGAGCRVRAETASSCPSFSNIPAVYEKPKNPAIDAALESCFAELSRAQADLRSLYREGRVKRFLGIQGMWQAYVNIPGGDFDFVFKSETGPILGFQKYVETDNHRHLVYDIDFHTNGMVKSFGLISGSTGAKFYPEGGIESFMGGIGDGKYADLRWGPDGKISSDYTRVPLPEFSTNPKDLPDLEEKLRHGDQPTKWGVLKSMLAIGSPSVPFVVEVLQDGDETARDMAVTILEQLGSKSAPAVPVLARRLLEDNSLGVRVSIAKCLGELGAVAQPAIPALEEASTNANPGIARMSQSSLRRIRRAASTQ
ncbi:MAG TPA: HEAT repeat domain-containing protein [Verrucomicrobiae bacterium]|nr:HEAT repeat domain-containing protein [Verrucomicrobiae bacterium]